MPARCIQYIVLLLVASAIGCRSTALPSLLHPGPTASQQEQTERTMSVSDTDLFTEAPGILPPGYTPRAEVQQSRNVIPNPWFEQNRSYYRQTGPPPQVYRPGLIGANGGPPAANAYPYSNPCSTPYSNPYSAVPGVSNAPQAIPSFY